MAIDPRRLERLDGVLSAVTPETALRLARAIELDRLRGGALPHETILGALRGKLRQSTPAPNNRLPTVRRLICDAFEPLLVNQRRTKQAGRIARSSLTPVWHWLTETLIADQMERLTNAIGERILGGGPDFADTAVDAFHAAAADAILAVVPTPDLTDDRTIMAGRALGGAAVAADAYDMARMMQIGAEIRGLRRALRRSSIQALTEEDISTIRGTWEGVVANKPDCAPYVVFYMLGMLEHSWEAMRLVGALSRRMDDVLVSRTDFGEIGNLLFTDLEDCVESLSSIRPSEICAANVLPAVETFSTLSTGIVRELGIKRDGIWGKRMMTTRAAMADQMDRLLEFAARDIAKTLPMARKGGLALRARRLPDMSRLPDLRRATHAIELARVIARSRPHAMAGAFAGMLADVDEKVCDALRTYISEMPDVLLTTAPELRPQADVYVRHALALTSILLGDEEADIVRRRVAAATASSGQALVA